MSMDGDHWRRRIVLAPCGGLAVVGLVAMTLTPSPGVNRTFRQQAIIDRLASVVNSIDGRVQPSLPDNGKIEEIARILMPGSHQPKR